MLSILGASVATASYRYSSYNSSSSPEEAAAVMVFMGFIFLFVCMISLVSFAVQFLIAYLVYRDAQKNRVDNPILWAAITFFSWWLGLLLYFFVAKQQARTVEVKHHAEHKQQAM
jgi:Na+/proline symporter